MTYLTFGFPLKYHCWREADRLYTIYTKDYGKLELLARGANKIKSKLAGHLEPGLLSDLMIAKGKSWDILAQAKTVFWANFLNNLAQSEAPQPGRQSRNQENLPANSQKFILFLSCLEVLDKLTALADPHPEIFDLLVNVLKCLDQTDKISMKPCLIFFFKLFYLLGYGPDLKKCLKCKANVETEYILSNVYAEYILSLQDGGLICQNCYSQAGEIGQLRLNSAEVSQLKNLLLADILKDDIIINDKFKKIIWQYLKYVLEGREIISFALI